jgi:hypothetical protein
MYSEHLPPYSGPIAGENLGEGTPMGSRDGELCDRTPSMPDNSFAPLQSRTDSEVILPTAMAGGNSGLVLCQVGGQ